MNNKVNMIIENIEQNLEDLKQVINEEDSLESPLTLNLRRVAKKDTYTIGKLYINGEFFCDTLEDTDRGLTSSMSLEEIKSIKQRGITAIPTGTYDITLDVISPKFSKYKQYDFIDGKLPRLIDVPGFEGILIHIGNYPKDTDGCILVGENKAVGAVLNSTETFKKLYEKLSTSNDIRIIIS